MNNENKKLIDVLRYEEIYVYVDEFIGNTSVKTNLTVVTTIFKNRFITLKRKKEYKFSTPITRVWNSDDCFEPLRSKINEKLLEIIDKLPIKKDKLIEEKFRELCIISKQHGIEKMYSLGFSLIDQVYILYMGNYVVKSRIKKYFLQELQSEIDKINNEDPNYSEVRKYLKEDTDFLK